MICLKDPETQYLNGLVKKYGKDIDIHFGHGNNQYSPNQTKSLEGTFSIKSIRKYRKSSIGFGPCYEIDLILNGKVFAWWNGERKFWSSELLQNKNVSKIRVNKLIRKHIVRDIQLYLLTFGIDVNPYISLSVKKVEWV